MARRAPNHAGWVSDTPDKTGRYRGHITLDGVRHERRDRDRAAVVAQIAALARQAAEGRAPPKRDPTLLEWLTEWIDRRNTNGRLRDSTLVSAYEPLVRLHIAPRLGKVRLSKLTTDQLERLYTELLTKRRQVARKDGAVAPAPPLSAQTVLNVHRLLHAALKAAERRGLVLRNPAALAEPPVVRREAARELDPFTVAAVLRAAAGHQDEALIWLAIGTGLRQGELFRLRWSDVDIPNGRLTVRERVRRIPGVGFDVAPPKSAAGIRTIVLPGIVLAALRAHRERQPTLPRRRGRGGAFVPDLVFANGAGGYVEQQNWLVRVWRPLLRRAGVDETIPFRELTRKAQASMLVHMGIDAEALRRRMGHADASVTFRHYTLAVTGGDAQVATSYDRALRALLTLQPGEPPPDLGGSGANKTAG